MSTTAGVLLVAAVTLIAALAVIGGMQAAMNTLRIIARRIKDRR